MRKNLPLIIIGVGVLVVFLAAFVVVRTFRGNTVKETPETEEEVVPELPQEQWPVVSLVPVADPAIPNSLGHLLKLKVESINVPNAATLDYLMVYTTSNGGQQGVPGTVQLTGSGVDKNLLLGSESSGKYRFDEGVTNGTITLTFRNGSGKSMGKITSDFHFQKDEAVLTSVDGKFTYTLDKATKGVWFLVMPTFRQPEANPNLVVWSNGYGVFSSDGKSHSGK